MKRLMVKFILGDRLRVLGGKEIGNRKIRLRIEKWIRKKKDLRKAVKKIRENKKKNTCIVCSKHVCSLMLTILLWQVGVCNNLTR